ncbi:MAG: metallophosphoesterase [Aquirufa sp.]
MVDLIGDIHGHADKLEEILAIMGYVKEAGVYQHPAKRKLVFLGDYIDRGPKIRETLQIVKSMCDAGHAIAIMGNHEFNAICFHTKDKVKGGFYRKHTVVEIDQHIETLRQFRNYTQEWEQVYLPWFHTLPLYLELDDFRAVHACWDDAHINWLENNTIYEEIQGQKRISEKVLAQYASKESPVYEVLEELLKGKEFDLPTGQEFVDKDGTTRKSARIKWFQPVEDRKLHKDVFLGIGEEFGDLVLEESIHDTLHRYDAEKSVFFGHYWLKGKPTDALAKSICLDYSVAKDGHLVAYRLNAQEFVIV